MTGAALAPLAPLAASSPRPATALPTPSPDPSTAGALPASTAGSRLAPRRLAPRRPVPAVAATASSTASGSPTNPAAVPPAAMPANDPAGRPTAAGEAPATRPGSILRNLEARSVTGWLNGQADRAEGPEPAATPPAAIPGAYLAPSAAFSAPVVRLGQLRAAESMASPAPVPAYATSATGAAAPVAFAPTFRAPADEARSGAAAGPAGLSVQAPAELAGWLTIAGSAIAGMSFLMPWSRDGVIGAVGSAYFDRWGLANGGYLPLVLAAVALLAVNGVPNPIPTWIRAGLAPLAIGGILFGLDWAYQTRPYSDGLGVTLLLVSALVLMVGGIIGVRTGRHQAAPPLV